MPFDADHDPDLRKWISGQRVALGASLIAAHDLATASDQDLVFKNLWPDCRLPEERHRRRYVQRLQNLPPAALELLATLPHHLIEYWEDHQALWKEALEGVLWDGQRSPVAGAKLVADRIRAGIHKPAQIVRLARLELGADWSGDGDLEQALAVLIQDHSEVLSWQARAAALERFGQAARPPRWHMVENALLQNAQSWPLLVLEQNEAIACALPITVDVRFESDASADLKTGPNVVCHDWQPSLKEALSTAIELWELKHGSWDLDFQRAVRRASVTIDLTVASEIVAPYVERFGRFRFVGGSLETALALEILSHFLARPGLQGTCATGKLGSRIPNGTGKNQHRKGADRNVEGMPTYLEQKIDCARRNFFFDQIIVPRGTVQPGYVDHLRVSPAARFSQYASSAFGQRWRRHTYVRAADMSAAFRRFKRESLSDEESREIKNAFDAISHSTTPIVRLRGIRATSVAQALCQVNDAVTNDMSPEFNRFEKNERQASFAFIRIAGDESNDRLWRVVWDSIGGDEASFRQFAFTVSRRRPATILAEQLNYLKPTPARPARAPDVLVLVREHASSIPDVLPTGPFSRLQLDAIVRELQQEEREKKAQLINPAHNPVVRRHLGRTRLVIVDQEIIEPKVIALDRDEELAAACEALSVFRYGFTLDMASAMLGVSHEECASTLRAIGAIQYGGDDLLAFAESAGEHLLRAKVDPPADPKRAASLHFRAANAIVGFLERTERATRFDFQAALQPSHLHEAQWHLNQAARLVRRVSQADASKYLNAIERLSRLGEPFGWTQMYWAERFSNQADNDLWAALQDHMVSWPRAMLIHPQELILAAKFAHKLYRRKVSGGSPKAEIAAIDLEKWTFLRSAVQACSALPVSEQTQSRFLVATTRACMTMSEAPGKQGLARAKADNEIAFNLLPEALSIMSPEWFEYAGDACWDHAAAADLYRQGFWNEKLAGAGGLRVETLAKYLGACTLAGFDPDPAIHQRLGPALTAGARYRVRSGTGLQTGLSGLKRARDRWTAGCTSILSWR